MKYLATVFFFLFHVSKNTAKFVWHFPNLFYGQNFPKNWQAIDKSHMRTYKTTAQFYTLKYYIVYYLMNVFVFITLITLCE